MNINIRIIIEIKCRYNEIKMKIKGRLKIMVNTA